MLSPAAEFLTGYKYGETLEGTRPALVGAYEAAAAAAAESAWHAGAATALEARLIAEEIAHLEYVGALAFLRSKIGEAA